MKVRVAVVFFTVLNLYAKGQGQLQMLTVEEAVQLALANNYDVEVSRNYAESVNLDNSYSIGGLLPQLNGTASKTWNTSNQEQLLAADSTRPELLRQQNGVRTTQQAAGVQLTWTLFDGTRMFATRERLGELAAQGDMLLKDQMTNSVAQVVVNYHNIVRQKQQLAAINEQMSVSEERVKLAERKLQVGTGGKPELLQARVDLNALRTQALQQETLIAQLKDQLRGLVGMKIEGDFEVSDTIIIDLNLRREDIETGLETRNFNLLAAKQDTEIAHLIVRERRGEMFPQINFNSAYTYSRTDNTVSLNPGVPLYSQNGGYSYGFSASVPILQAFNRRRLMQQAKINQSRTQILYEQQKMVVNVSVSNAYVNYENAKKILEVEEETILLAKENVFIALESFKRSVATFIELRTAQQSLADAYNRLITARYNAKLAETELLRLNGSLLK
jgi:outer membrane protein